MNILNLHAALQSAPRAKETYRRLAAEYQKLGKTGEAEAYLELIRRKFDHRPDSDEEPRGDGRPDP